MEYELRTSIGSDEPRLFKTKNVSEQAAFVVGDETHRLGDLCKAGNRFAGRSEGKVLAVTVPGATTDFAARVLLQQARLTQGKDVKLLYLKGMVEILAGKEPT